MKTTKKSKPSQYITTRYVYRDMNHMITVAITENAPKNLISAKEEKMVEQIRKDIAKDLNEKVLTQLNKVMSFIVSRNL